MRHKKLVLMLMVLANVWIVQRIEAKNDSVAVEQELLYTRPVQVLDNGVVSVKVSRDIGARILSFRTNATGKETIRIDRANIEDDPNDYWHGADYGGLFNVGTNHWPGSLWPVSYDVAVEHGEVGPQLTFEYQDKDRGVCHTMQVALQPNSSILQVQAGQVNAGAEDQLLVNRLHGEFGIGQAADDQDIIMFSGADGVVKIPYKLGWENPRFSYEQLHEDWLACLDTEEEVALFRRFLLPEGPIKVFFWRGHNEAGNNIGFGVRDEKGGFYALDRILEPVMVAPGQGLSAKEELFIIDGMGQVDFVKDYWVAGVRHDKQMYGRQEQVATTIYVGSALAQGPINIICSQSSDSGSANEIDRLQTQRFQPGLARRYEVSWVPQDSAAFQVDLVDQEGVVIGTFYHDITVNDEMCRQAQRTARALAQETNAFRSQVRDAVHLNAYQKQVLISYVQYFRDNMERLMAQGRYANVADVYHEAQRAMILLKKTLEFGKNADGALHLDEPVQ